MKHQTRDGTWHEFTSDEEHQRQLLIDLGAPLSEVNDYIMCDRQLAHAIANGTLYYDYTEQRWMNTEPTLTQ